jgi:ribonuclease J
VPLGGGVMAARKRMLFNGVAVASLAVDAAGRLLGRPRLSAPGLFELDDPETDRISGEIADSLADLPTSLRRDDAALTEAARASLRRALGKRLQKRPLVEVHVLRVP